MAKIFVVTSDYQADVKCFKVAHDYQADMLVHVVDNDYQADGDEKWFYVKNDHQATTKIFWTQNDYQADLKVFSSGKATKLSGTSLIHYRIVCKPPHDRTFQDSLSAIWSPLRLLLP